VVADLQKPDRPEALRKSKSAQAYNAALPIAKRILKTAADAGLLIARGTDSGASANRFQGYFEHLEMQMMEESGLTPAQILRSATGDAARAMGVQDIGTIAKGNWADFVVYDRDPLAEIRDTKTIRAVYVAGNEVKR
jgi:imidazolonepropionase-like amidohydrolase